MVKDNLETGELKLGMMKKHNSACQSHKVGSSGQIIHLEQSSNKINDMLSNIMF